MLGHYPIVGQDVTFTIVSGPHAGQTGTDTTDANGQATFTYTGTSEGTDVIEATMVDSQGNTVTSNQVTKEWTPITPPPMAPVPTLTPIGLIALVGLLSVVAAISISTSIRKKRR